MKRYLLLLLAAILMLPVFAANDGGVLMMGFRQEWHERHAYMVLKNNTDEQLTRVRGELSVYSVSGQLLDELMVNERVKLEPGEMAEVRIRPYGRKEGYVYEQNQSSVPDGENAQVFTVRFKSSNGTKNSKNTGSLSVQEELQKAEQQAADDRTWNILRITAGVTILLLLAVFYFLIPIRMAERRGRNWMPWVVVAILATPIIPILALWLIGKKS